MQATAQEMLVAPSLTRRVSLLKNLCAVGQQNRIFHFILTSGDLGSELIRYTFAILKLLKYLKYNGCRVTNNTHSLSICPQSN